MRARVAAVATGLQLAATLGASDGSEAQVLRDTNFRGAVTVRGEVQKQTTRAPGQAERRFDEQIAEEEIELNFDGAVLSPRLVRYRLGGNFGLRQGWRDASFGGAADTDGTLFGYDADLSLLPASLISLQLAASRFEDQLDQSFGADTESSGDLIGATVRAKIPWLPSSVAWRRADSDVRSIGTIFDSRRSERREIFEYTGERFTTTDQVLIRFRDEDVADESVPAAEDYRVREVSALLGRRFGTYLEKNLRGSARWFERAGVSDFRSIAASGAFDWAPTQTLTTSAQYDFNRFDADRFDSTEHTGAISIRHELYQSLRTQLSAFATEASRDDGGRLAAGASLSLAYRKQLPRQSQLEADLRAGYRHQDNDFRSGIVAVRGEQITLVAFTGNLLASPRVDLATVRVFHGPSGPLLVEGVDYRLDVIGNRVAIDVFPGGLVNLGDTLAVDYEFAVNPAATTGTTSFSIGVGWANDWLSLRYEHDRQDEDLLDGDARSLQDSRRDTLRAGLSWARPRFDVQGGIELVRERTETFDYDEIALTQSLRWRLPRGFDVSLHAREARRDFTTPDRRNDLFSGGASVTWRVGIAGMLRAHLEYRNYQDTFSFDQDDLEVGVSGRLRYGRIELIPAVRWTLRTRGPLETEDVRGSLALRRSF